MSDNNLNIVNYNPAQAALIASGWQLFNHYGIRKITIEQICREARISKVTFYKYFKNKEDFLYQMLESVFHVAMKEVQELLFNEKSYPARMNDLLLWKMKQLDSWSELFLNDLITFGPEFEAFLQKWTLLSMQQFMIFIEQGKTAGAIRASLNSQFILYTMDAFAKNIYKDNSFVKTFGWEEMTFQMMEFFIYGIMGENGNK